MPTKVAIEKISDISFDVYDVLKRSIYADHPDARRILLHFISSSDIVYIGKFNDKIACVLGLVPPTLLSDSAFLWLFVTSLINEHQFLFIRHSQLLVERLLKRYPTIIGMTDASNKSAIRWIKWLGGEYTMAPGERMLRFVIRKKNNG
jgi:hypothetical protein